MSLRPNVDPVDNSLQHRCAEPRGGVAYCHEYQQLFNFVPYFGNKSSIYATLIDCDLAQFEASTIVTDKDLPFDGLNVLDLSQGIAGPYCGMLLARNGANVIKLEPPGAGCWSRQLGKSKGDQTAHSVVVHRGKRSLALNLKTSVGVEIAQKLASEADVLLQNYRVGKIDQFGLDYDTVASGNPTIVYASVSGFGNRGARTAQPATDSVMQAYTGIMSINRDVRGMPQRINMLAIDFATGLYAFQAVSAALYKRATKGVGGHIETSLLEASLVFQEAALIDSAMQVGPVEPIGMPVGTFQTADGYMSINARRQKQFEAFAKLVGHPEWVDDQRFCDATARVANGAALLEQITPIIETKPTAEWCAKLVEIDVDTTSAVFGGNFGAIPFIEGTSGDDGDPDAGDGGNGHLSGIRHAKRRA